MSYRIDKQNKKIYVDAKFIKIKTYKLRAGFLTCLFLDRELAIDRNFINELLEIGVQERKIFNFEECVF